MSLVVVGTVAFDALETPYGKTDKIVGGAATYISISANNYIKPVKIVSVVGEDYDMEMLAELKSRGIEQEGLQIKKGEKSFFWKGKYHEDMNQRDTLITELNVLENFEPVVPDSYQDCEYLMLGNLDPNVQLSVLEQLKKRPKLVVLDTMNFWMEIALDKLKEVISKVDVLTINDEEARLLTEESSLVVAARKIFAMGVSTLIIKKGEHGALLFQGTRMFYAPAMPLDVVKDPTGAGDTFAGGFIGYLAKTDDLSFDNMKKALIHASAMASYCVEEFGTEKVLNISQEDIDARLVEFNELTTY